MTRIATALADLVLGARCAGCGVPAVGLCPGCTALLAGLRPRPAPRALAGYPATMAAGEYADQLRRVLIATKQRGGLTHLPLLSRLLARSVAALVLTRPPTGRVILVAVPTVRARVLERGLDLTSALARRAASELARCGLVVTARSVVELARVPADQVGLGRQQRTANAAGAFRCRGNLPEGSVVIVDDIVTTGSTLVAMAAALRRSGVEPLGAATVAQTPRRGGQKAPAPG